MSNKGNSQEAQITLNGINRKVKGKNFPNGTLSDMCNMRIKDGNWIGLGDKVQLADIGQTPTAMYIHDLGNDGFALAYVYKADDSTQVVKVRFFNSDWELQSSQTLKSDLDEDETIYLSSIDNILVATISNMIYYFVYESEDTAYREIPPFPSGLTVKPYWKRNEPFWLITNSETSGRRTTTRTDGGDTQFDYDKDTFLYGFEELETWNTVDADFEDGRVGFLIEDLDDEGDEEWSTAHTTAETVANQYYTDLVDDEKVIVGEFFAVFAYRLFDGSIIKPSNPIKLCMSCIKSVTEKTAVMEQTDSTVARCMVAYLTKYKRALRIVFDQDELSNIVDNFDGIITGIDMYISPSATFEIDDTLAVNIDGSTVTDDTEYYRFDGHWKINNELNIEDVDNFYFLATLQLSDLQENESYYEYTKDIEGSDTVSSWDVMDEDDNTYHTIGCLGKPISYNGRILFPEIFNTYFKGFDASYIEEQDRGLEQVTDPATNATTYTSGNIVAKEQYSIAFLVELTTDIGKKELFSGWQSSTDWVAEPVIGDLWEKTDGEITDYYTWVEKTSETISNITYPYSIYTANGIDLVYYVPFTFYPTFVFPDGRATKVTFMFRMDEGDAADVIWKKSFTLVPHDTLNLAYIEEQSTALVDSSACVYLYEVSEIYSDTEQDGYNGLVPLQFYKQATDLFDNNHAIFIHPDCLDYDTDGYSITANQPDMSVMSDFEEPETATKIDYNRVQVSELDNPFVFPSENSYRVGNGSITAMADAMNEFGSGQFGQYPVVVFSDDGIWALEISTSGDTFISNVVPLAKDTTNDADSVAVVKEGIFFASDTGLKLLSGKQSVKVSDVVEGSNIAYDDVNTILDYYAEKDSISDLVSSVTFKEYIADCKIGYDRTNNEMIISNTAYSYSYVFMFDSKVWTKRATTYESFYNAFPYELGTIGSIVYNMSDEGDIDNTAFFVTNPIELSRDGFTKLEQMMIRGYLGATKVIVMGSTDNVNYKRVLTNITTKDKQDIELNRVLYSCKSYILIIITAVGEDNYINRIETLFSVKFNKKLR